MGTNTIDLAGGTIEYEDSGGAGPVVVLLHGFLMDSSLWDGVVEKLAADHRCVVPTLPLGAHRLPMDPEADLSLRGIARLVGEFIDRLGLQDVTLVGNDTGGALVQLLAGENPPRVARIVLASCEAFDNYPPGVSGKMLALTGKLSPTAFGLFMQQLRLRPIRRLPIAFGWMTRRGDATTARWIRPILEQSDIRRDAIRALRAVPAEPDLMRNAAERLPDFDKPALVVWAEGDRIMPPEDGRHLAEVLPQGTLVEVTDSDTLIPLDQPTRLAQAIRQFVAGS